MSVKVDINVPKILNSRGLGGNKGAQRHLASEVARFCDPYVPMQQGFLKNSVSIALDGSQVIYQGPYAHYHYYGEVMAGRAPKKYTGKKLKHHGANRGAMWDKRMLADKSKEIEKSLDVFVKRGV